MQRFLLPGLPGLLGILALALVAVAPQAQAQQDIRPLLDRLERMERELGAVQRHVYRGDAPAASVPTSAAPVELPTDTAGRLQVRMSEMERMMSDLTGRLEQAQFENRRLTERLEQMSRDMEFRLNRLEGGPIAGEAPAANEAPTEATGNDGLSPAGALSLAPGAPVPGTGQGVLGVLPSGSAGGSAGGPARGGAPLLTPPPAAQAPLLQPPASQSPAPLPALPAGASARDQYEYAFALLRRNAAAEAEVAFQEFLKANPDHELAGNAQYWLGETHYVRGDMQRAAVAFLDGYRTYPRSEKAPDNLLKLGMSMGALGRTQEACAALQRLGAEYPQGPDAIKRRAVAERARLGCS